MVTEQTKAEIKTMSEWQQQALFVTNELQRLNKNVERFFDLHNEQSKTIAKLQTEIEVIKTRAAMAGVISGTIATAVIQLSIIIVNKFLLHGV